MKAAYNIQTLEAGLYHTAKLSGKDFLPSPIDNQIFRSWVEVASFLKALGATDQVLIEAKAKLDSESHIRLDIAA